MPTQPEVVYADAISNNASSVVIPTNASLQNGDKRYIVISISTSTITGIPSGWATESPTPILFQTTRRIYVFSKTHSDTDGSFTFTFSAAANFAAIPFATRGHHPSTPMNIAPVVGSGSSGNTLTSPSITPTVSDTLVIRTFHVLLNDSAVTLTDPTACTRLDYQAGTGSGGHATLGVRETNSSPANTAVGTKTSTLNNPFTSVWGAMTMAIAPAPDAIKASKTIKKRRRRAMYRR